MSAAADPGVTLDAGHLVALRALALGVPEARQRASALPGGFVTRKHGQGQEMADIRAYVPGDDFRHIDRAATARTGELHVRTFHDERDRTTLLVADMRPAMLWGLRRAFLSVAAAEALTLLGWRIVAAGGRVGLVALTGGGPVLVRPRGRSRGMLAVIGGLVRGHDRALATAAGLADEPLDRALPALGRVAPTGAQVVLASSFDAPGEALDRRLARLARRRHLRLIAVGDGAQRHLAAGDYPIVTPDRRRVTARIAAAAAEAPGTTPAGWPTARIDADRPPAELAALDWTDGGYRG